MNENQDKVFNKTSINWYPGHMAKTKKQIIDTLPIVDIVFELIDSRIPNSSKIKDIESLTKNKPRILIMSKADLCDINETNKWVKKYETDGYRVVLANLNNPSDIKKINNIATELGNSINEVRMNKGLKAKEIKALVVGIPNVGKSTFINKMAGKKVAGVGNTPGVTKNLVWLKTNMNILLLDTPGILWPKFANMEESLNLASFQAIKEDILPVDEVAIHILTKLNKYYNSILNERYKIDHVEYDDIVVTYDAIGKKIGALISGGEIDYDRVSRAIINDIRNEHVKGITFDRI